MILEFVQGQTRSEREKQPSHEKKKKYSIHLPFHYSNKFTFVMSPTNRIRVKNKVS